MTESSPCRQPLKHRAWLWKYWAFLCPLHPLHGEGTINRMSVYAGVSLFMCTLAWPPPGSLQALSGHTTSFGIRLAWFDVVLMHVGCLIWGFRLCVCVVRHYVRWALKQELQAGSRARESESTFFLRGGMEGRLDRWVQDETPLSCQRILDCAPCHLILTSQVLLMVCQNLTL